MSVAINPKTANLNFVRTFVVCAEMGSFSEAARLLNVTAGAVSQQIKALEDRLSTTLFSRTRQGLRMTRTGQDLFTAARPAFGIIEEAISGLNGQRPELSISASPTLAACWLVPNLGQIDRSNCDFVVDLAPGCAIRSNVTADIYLLHGRSSEAVGKEILFDDDLICVGTSDQRDAFRCAAPAPGATLLTWKTYDFWGAYLPSLGRDDIASHVVHRFGHLILCIQAARAGQGILLVNRRFVAEDLRNGGLVALSEEEVKTGYCYFVDAEDPVVAQDFRQAVAHFC